MIVHRRIVPLFLLVIAALLVSGCSLPFALPFTPPPTPTTIPTVTPTPFQPLPPTAVYLPTPTFTPTPTITPSPTPVPTATPQPGTFGAGPASPIPHADERINIMLLGSDRRPGHADFRTDAFMLLSYNPQTGATSLISIPRDTYVYLPALKRWHRINTAMEFGGFPLLADTLAYNFGVRPQHFVMVDFQGFATLVDRLGGVDIYVPYQLCDRRTHYGDHYCIGPGTIHMDGSLALWYARSRKTTSDFSRASRQQALVLAMVRKLLSLNGLARAPQLYTAYRNIFTTDIGLGDLTAMLLQARHFDPNAIRTYLLKPPALRPWITPQGSYVLIQNYPQVRALLEEALQR